MRNFTLQQEPYQWRLIVHQAFVANLVPYFLSLGGRVDNATHDKWEGITEEWVFPNSTIKGVAALLMS